MKVALTGATGFIGSHVLAELEGHGHEVTALVRDDAQAEAVAARGVTPAVVDLYDRPAVVSLLSDADGAIHTASPGDETSANLDSAVVDAAIEAFDGTGKPYLHISGAWVYGDNTHISEESPFNSPAMVAWREPIEKRLLDATGMRGVVIVSGVAYGDGGGGVPGLLLGSPRDDARQPDHARHGTAALVDGPRRRPGGLLPARPGGRLGPWLLRHRRRTQPDRCRADRGGRRRRRRSGSRPGLRRRGSGPLGRLFRRGAPARSGHRRGQGSRRARLAPVRTRDSSTSSATGATASKRRTPEHGR